MRSTMCYSNFSCFTTFIYPRLFSAKKKKKLKVLVASVALTVKVDELLDIKEHLVDNELRFSSRGRWEYQNKAKRQ